MKQKHSKPNKSDYHTYQNLRKNNTAVLNENWRHSDLSFPIRSPGEKKLIALQKYRNKVTLNTRTTSIK